VPANIQNTRYRNKCPEQTICDFLHTGIFDDSDSESSQEKIKSSEIQLRRNPGLISSVIKLKNNSFYHGDWTHGPDKTQIFHG
jgi:hypothetical protein